MSAPDILASKFISASENDLWNRLFQNVPVGAYRMAPDGHLLCVNPALLKIHGCAAFEEIIERDTDAARALLLYRLKREDSVQGLEHLWTTQNGAEVSVRENVAAVRGGDGQVLYYEGTVESISGRGRTKPSLEPSAEILRSFYESVPQMMGVVELADPGSEDGEDIIHMAGNTSSARSFGLTAPEEMQGRRSSDLGVSPVNIRRWRNHYLQSARTGKPVRFEYDHQLSSEAESLWYSVTVQHIQGNRFCYIVSDITGQRRQESYHRLLQAAVEDANDVVMIMEAE
jgi:PAS domain S-box-containing protein